MVAPKGTEVARNKLNTDLINGKVGLRSIIRIQSTVRTVLFLKTAGFKLQWFHEETAAGYNKRTAVCFVPLIGIIADSDLVLDLERSYCSLIG